MYALYLGSVGAKFHPTLWVGACIHGDYTHKISNFSAMICICSSCSASFVWDMARSFRGFCGWNRLSVLPGPRGNHCTQNSWLLSRTCPESGRNVPVWEKMTEKAKSCDWTNKHKSTMVEMRVGHTQCFLPPSPIISPPPILYNKCWPPLSLGILLCCTGLATLSSTMAAPMIWWLHIIGSSHASLVVSSLFVLPLMLMSFFWQFICILWVELQWLARWQRMLVHALSLCARLLPGRVTVTRALESLCLCTCLSLVPSILDLGKVEACPLQWYLNAGLLERWPLAVFEPNTPAMATAASCRLIFRFGLLGGWVALLQFCCLSSGNHIYLCRFSTDLILFVLWFEFGTGSMDFSLFPLNFW